MVVDAFVCNERGSPILVSLPQVKSAEGISSFLEVGTRYVADCEGDVPLRARLPYLSGASLIQLV